MRPWWGLRHGPHLAGPWPLKVLLMLNSFPVTSRRPQAGPKAESSQMQMAAQPTPQNGSKNLRQRQTMFLLHLLLLWIWKLWGQSKWQSQLRTPGGFPHWKMNHRQQKKFSCPYSLFFQTILGCHPQWLCDHQGYRPGESIWHSVGARGVLCPQTQSRNKSIFLITPALNVHKLSFL